MKATARSRHRAPTRIARCAERITCNLPVPRAASSGVVTPVRRVALLIAAALALATLSAEAAPIDFVNDLYPRLESHNCRACHNASGVASETRLHFPEHGSHHSVIERFGMSMSVLVDRDRPSSSLLIAKPTNRIPHTGGPLIAEGSDDEQRLRAWAGFLANQPPPGPDLEGGGRIRVSEPIRRLTHAQYDNSVRDLLGDRMRPSRNFPPEDFVNGYTNQASAQAITPALAEAYGRAAEKLARNAFRYGDEGRLIPCTPSGPADQHCAGRFVRGFGMRAYRRPLAPAEVEALVDLLLEWAARRDSFLAGASAVVEAVLQSPSFLFLVSQEPGVQAKRYEIASRLSYALWDTVPDADLLDLAARGELNSMAAVERQARRMLAKPAARESLDRFFAQWMRFDRLQGAVKDRGRFRNYGPEVADSMCEESRRLFGHIVWSDIDFRHFFTADFTFVDDFLTEVYGLPDPDSPYGRVQYTADSPRGGILGHGTFLAQTGKPASTSPTERGLFVREHFLCQTIPPPPPGVDASLPPLTPGAAPLSAREIMTSVHATDESCASCHKLVDPIGFGFEHFDTIGAYRETEAVRVEPTPQQEQQGMKAETHQLAIDSSAYIAGIPDSAFRSPREAGLVLASSPTCHKCVVKQLFRYFFGRHETRRDADLIDRAYNRFRDSGFIFRELVLELLVSQEFLQTDFSN